MNARDSEHRRVEAAQVPAGFEPPAVARISAALTITLADLFALYVKTKNLYRAAFPRLSPAADEQSEQILATTDAMGGAGQEDRRDDLAFDRPHNPAWRRTPGTFGGQAVRGSGIGLKCRS